MKLKIFIKIFLSILMKNSISSGPKCIDKKYTFFIKSQRSVSGTWEMPKTNLISLKNFIKILILWKFGASKIPCEIAISSLTFLWKWKNIDLILQKMYGISISKTNNDKKIIIKYKKQQQLNQKLFTSSYPHQMNIAIAEI